jgi:hypothetical protein
MTLQNLVPISIPAVAALAVELLPEIGWEHVAGPVLKQ